MSKTPVLRAGGWLGRWILSFVLLALLVVGALPVKPVQAAGTVLIDTFSWGAGSVANTELASGFSYAQSFHATDPATYVIQQVELNLYRSADAAGTFTVNIFSSDVSNFPSVLEGTVASGNIATDLSVGVAGNDIKKSYTILNLPVTHGTGNYYVVVTATTSAGSVYWGYASDCTGGAGIECSGYPSYYSDNSGGSWNTPTEGLPQRMKIWANSNPTAVTLSNLTAASGSGFNLQAQAGGLVMLVMGLGAWRVIARRRKMAR